MRGAPPRRTCVGCRAVRPKDDLLRLTRTPQGVRFDPDHRLPGRGAYLCPDEACVAAASRRDAGAIRRALRGAPADEVRRALDALHTERRHDPGASSAP